MRRDEMGEIAMTVFEFGLPSMRAAREEAKRACAWPS